MINQQKRAHEKIFKQEIHGIIYDISSGGKGSYKLMVKRSDFSEDSIYINGLGYNDDDILMNDSIAKKSKDHDCYFYRKTDSIYRLHYVDHLRPW